MNKFETYLEGRRVFALADLHLSLASPKPMDVFGAQWESHAERIAAAWRETVRPEDIVLVAGDISWAMKLEDAQADLDWIAALPGEKVFIKGNHDYWWNSLGKVRQAGGAGMHFIQNDCVRLGALAIGGTRMWDFPSVRWPGTVAVEEEKSPAEKNANKERGEDAEKIRERELNRLRLSLQALKDAPLKIAMTHFPPVGSDGQPTEITSLIAEYGIDLCVYGHLHAIKPDPLPGTDCEIAGVRYLLTSCDWLGFRPLRVG
jgi:predicted phosphohydrolase